jgi:hypothetical protein
MFIAIKLKTEEYFLTATALCCILLKYSHYRYQNFIHFQELL